MRLWAYSPVETERKLSNEQIIKFGSTNEELTTFGEFVNLTLTGGDALTSQKRQSRQTLFVTFSATTMQLTGIEQPLNLHEKMFCFVAAGATSPLFNRNSVLCPSDKHKMRATSFVPKRPRANALRTRMQPTATKMAMTSEYSTLLSTMLLSDISDVNKGPLFATAFVFFLTFWGGISFVKGSTKPRITQASFTLREPPGAIAKKTARYLMERSFVVDPDKDSREGVMTFTGNVRASSSVAAILVAVGASGLWSATYILNFVLPENLQSPYWGWLSVLAFLVVPWYWKEAARTEEVKVMVEEEDDVSILYLKGHRDEIEELERAFNWKRNQPVYEGDEGVKKDRAEPVGSGK